MLSKLDSRRRRLLAIIALCALLIAVTAGVAAWVNSVTSSHGHSFSDRMAEDTVIIAGGTLALALIAAVVAVMAFAAATGLPDLKLTVEFPYSSPNEPRFLGEPGEDGLFVAKSFKQTTGRISLRNISGYSAKNPSVVVRLHGMAFTLNEYTQKTEWVVTSFANTIGVLEVQWDGGPTYSIHGHSIRKLPDLDLDKLHQVPVPGNASPSITFELLAEGYRRVVSVPVLFAKAAGATTTGKTGFWI